MQGHPTGRPGSYLVKWFLDSRKLKSNDKQVISPGFMLYHPRTGQFLRFLFGAVPKDWSAANPEANFKKAEGKKRLLPAEMRHPAQKPGLFAMLVWVLSFKRGDAPRKFPFYREQVHRRAT